MVDRPDHAEQWQRLLRRVRRAGSLCIGSSLIQGVRAGQTRMGLAFGVPACGLSAITGAVELPLSVASGVLSTFLSEHEAEELCARRLEARPTDKNDLPPLATGALHVRGVRAFGDFLGVDSEAPSLFMGVTLRHLVVRYDDPLDGAGAVSGELHAGWTPGALRPLRLQGTASLSAEYHVEARAAGEVAETLRYIQLRCEATPD